MTARTRRQQQAEGTREAFLRAGRELFAEKGYAAASIEEITGRLHAARGSLYHHFPGKRALFRAVVERVEAEIMQAMFAASAAGSAGRSGWDRAAAGGAAFLDACQDPGVQRILLFDAPAVLDPDPDAEDRLLDLARASFADLFGPEERPALDPAPVASALLGALRGLAVFAARAEDPEAARREAGVVLERMLAGLRAAGRTGAA